MKLGYIVGRFQPLHLGHIELINQLKKKYDHCIIFIGSANLSKTEQNPLTYSQRKAILSEHFDPEFIFPIDDVNNHDLWSNNLNQLIINFIQRQKLKTIKSIHFLSSNKGNDHQLRKKWMNQYNHNVDFYSIKKDISASQIRELIKQGKYHEVKKLTDKKTYRFIISNNFLKIDNYL